MLCGCFYSLPSIGGVHNKNMKNTIINMFFTSPLEQFVIYPIIPLRVGIIDISITNGLVISLLIILATIVFALSLVSGNSFKIIPNYWQSIVEILYKATLGLVTGSISDERGQKFFPLICTIFFLIMSINLIGLVPYSFTLTSHLIVTFAIALSVFIGINMICAKEHGIKAFALFLPPGTPVVLALLLVPIEIISYVFKPVSLSIRLFANMMAGHTLLKVIAGFAFTLLGASGILFLLHYVPLMILIPLMGLELAVAIIQSYVFTILICIYLNDAINLH
jgi:ATP synthase subunit 6